MMDVSESSSKQNDPAFALLQDIFSGIDIGIAVLDRDLNFVLFNERYRDLALGPGIVLYDADMKFVMSNDLHDDF